MATSRRTDAHARPHRHPSATRGRPETSESARASRTKDLSASDIAVRAAAQLHESTGRVVESVIGLARVEDGWSVQVEVIDTRRIPNTADILAIFDVRIDGHGQLVGYRRTRRYARGSTQDD